jgi:hypothetical protein
MYTFNGVSIKSPEGDEKKLKKDSRTQMEVYLGMLNSQYNFNQITKDKRDEMVQTILSAFYNQQQINIV